MQNGKLSWTLVSSLALWGMSFLWSKYGQHAFDLTLPGLPFLTPHRMNLHCRTRPCWTSSLLLFHHWDETLALHS